MQRALTRGQVEEPSVSLLDLGEEGGDDGLLHLQDGLGRRRSGRLGSGLGSGLGRCYEQMKIRLSMT